MRSRSPRRRRVALLGAAVVVACPGLAVSQGGTALPPVVGIPEVAGQSGLSRLVFPVFGQAATFSNDFGAPRAGTGWHHGIDIFAATGTPVLAVADGELYSVGVNTLGGNRLWLRDGSGNTYYYAHLSAYAANVADGLRVKAGDIIAFVGNTGQAVTTPPHLHFEIHPGDGASVNPYSHLQAWRRGTTLAPTDAAAVATPATPATGGPTPTRPVPAIAGAALVGVDRPEAGAADAPTDDDGLAVAVP